MDIRVLLEIRGGSPTPRRDLRTPEMLVFRGINVPQRRVDAHPNREYTEGLGSHRFPVSAFGSPEQSPERSVVGGPSSSISSTRPRSVSSASDTSYHEVDSCPAFAAHAARSSPSCAPSFHSEWEGLWIEDEKPANGVWSPTFGPRPSIDNGNSYQEISAVQDSPSWERRCDEDWEGEDGPSSQDLSFERPANSSFKGLDSASSEMPRAYLEPECSPDRRNPSLSSEEIESLPPLHIICWTSGGHEKLWTPEDPHNRKILDAYLAEDHRGLEPGLYVWHNESGVECTLRVFDPKTRSSCDQTRWRETSIASAKELCPLPPHLEDLQVGFVSVIPRKGSGDDGEMLVPDNCISKMLFADKRWKVCDLPAGFVYRWREVSGATFKLDTGPSQFESSMGRFEA